MISAVTQFIPENHISMMALEKVRSIVKPLKLRHGIDYFNFTISYPNQTGFTLHTNPEFYESWFEEELPMCQFNRSSGWYFWEHCSAPKMIDIAQDLGIGKGIIHIDHKAGQSITTAFAMNPNIKEGESFYLNNLSMLKAFNTHFMNEAKDIIEQAKRETLTYLPNMIASTSSNIPHPENINDPEPMEWSFGPLQKLSPRELQCFQLIVNGFSMIDIGKKFNLSPSTVNMYVKRLKSKLHCQTKHELVELASQFSVCQ